MFRPVLVALALSCSVAILAQKSLCPGLQPGRATARIEPGSATLSNACLKWTWKQNAGKDAGVELEAWPSGPRSTPVYGQSWNESFWVTIGSDTIRSNELELHQKPHTESLKPEKSSMVEAMHYPGKALVAVLDDPQRKFTITLRDELRDGSNYVRRSLTVRSLASEVDVTRIAALSFGSVGIVPEVVGTVPGSLVVSEGLFWGCEHPMGSIGKLSETVRDVGLDRKIPVRKGVDFTVSFIVGSAPQGQMRRAVLNYVERERAHPYRPFLHFNSWYSLGYFTPFEESQCLQTIKKFGEELVAKRGAKMESFLFDDGWDDTSTVWEFNKGFPDGFSNLQAEAKKIGAAPGVWLSPWGGYGGPRAQRLATGKKEGMEVDSQGYALSGPNYYARFHKVCEDMVLKYGINQFKFDGTGSPDKYFPGSKFDSDFSAAIQLIGDLRKDKPDLFVNLTTGTWPSPFWLRYADSTWRGGSDHAFAGVGSPRQKWITYRDGDTYRGVVKRGPLYPLNSLMLHGLLYAKGAHPLDEDPGGEFKDEIRSYFGTGTQLQEMYIDPTLLSGQQWDWLAEAAKWSAKNASVLRDTHWIGGDPNNLEVYGWGAWDGGEGIVTLRNPSDHPQAYSFDVARALQLPIKTFASWSGSSPWADETGMAEQKFETGKSKIIRLKPFQVMTLELRPSAKVVEVADSQLTRPPVQTMSQNAVSRKIKVACVGASITQGVGVKNPGQDSYPAQLQKLLGAKYEVRNFGNSGKAITKAHPSSYWNQPEFEASKRFKPDIVIINLGGNDAAPPTWQKVADNFVGDTKAMVEAYWNLESKPKVFLTVPTPAIGDPRSENLEQDAVPLMRQAAREIGTPLIDFHNVLEGKTQLFPDHLHPNEEGAWQMALTAFFAIGDTSSLKASWKVLSVDSEQVGEGVGSEAIDGDLSTYWHTQYDPKTDKHPHQIIIDMGSPVSLSGVRETPRQDGGINGRVKGYKVYVSDDGEHWGDPVAQGDLPDTIQPALVMFKEPVNGRYLKFVALSEQGNGPWTSIAELDPVPARG